MARRMAEVLLEAKGISNDRELCYKCLAPFSGEGKVCVLI